jgi:hypothetical protein
MAPSLGACVVVYSRKAVYVFDPRELERHNRISSNEVEPLFGRKVSNILLSGLRAFFTFINPEKMDNKI